MKYRIASAHTTGDLALKVESWIAEGFEPIGGICSDKHGLMQAMVKVERQITTEFIGSSIPTHGILSETFKADFTTPVGQKSVVGEFADGIEYDPQSGGYFSVDKGQATYRSKGKKPE